MVKGVLRIIGRLLFFKFNDTPYANQMIEQMRQKGAEIVHGGGWIKVNMFPREGLIKIGGEEIEIEKKTPAEIESLLFNFYSNQYIKAGFKVETK